MDRIKLKMFRFICPLFADEFVGCMAFATEAKQSSQSTDAIKQMMIKESIESYPGNCPCPYNTASNGSRCGKRSALTVQVDIHRCVIRKM